MKILSFRSAVVCFISLLFISCGQKSELSYNQENYVHNDSLVSVEINYINFVSSNPNQQKWLNEITDSFKSNLMSRVDTLTADSKDLRASVDLPANFPPFELFVQDTVFVNSSKLISYMFSQYEMQGGAHGMTNFISFNLIPDKLLSLSMEEIINRDEESVKRVNELLEKNFDKKECFFVMPTVKQASAINVTNEGVLFTYEQYVLGPYACGVAQVLVPKADIIDYLNPVIADFYKAK